MDVPCLEMGKPTGTIANRVSHCRWRLQPATVLLLATGEPLAPASPDACKEKAMGETQQQTFHALNQLIAAGKDSELACMSGASDVNDMQLRDILTSTAASCRTSVKELQSMVSAMGGRPADRGSMQGTLRRGWMALRHMLQPGNDDAILSICEHEEEASRREYQAVLTKSLVPEANAMLQRQYEDLMRHHGRLHAMRGMKVH
jgi:uncharacterized protein (TIGR02284 family)